MFFTDGSDGPCLTYDPGNAVGACAPQTMVEMEIDIAKMPLGRLSRSQLSRGFSTLGEITIILEDQARALCTPALTRDVPALQSESPPATASVATRCQGSKRGKDPE